ncbi:MAG: M1 family metallopeptidase [Pseudomonadota bacterium]
MTRLTVTRLALAVTLAVAAVAARAEAPYSFASTPGKLPKDIVPIQYAAHLKPDLAANTFLGSQTIEIEVLKATSRIMLNVANLQIDAATLSGKGFDERKLTPQIDPQQESLTFQLEQPLTPGRYQLSLKFHGEINREARGMFHLQYKAGGADKTMIATQMEPTDARRLLPLWDEPAFRATFKLTVDLPGNFKAYSNTPIVKSEKIDGGAQRVSFGVTPSMPSYLLVLVAGELERTSLKQGGVDIGVVTTEGKQAQAAYALGATRDLLRYYNNYFGQAYPLAKLDQIAIPGGFNGAMENWGGIVYSDSALLFDFKTSPESTRQESFSINAHEVAHQWFGNLVTMAWWDNLWLNEGFASWMATKATDHFNPEWRVQLQALARREDVMNLDARKTTHPIQTPVTTEEQAAGAFDNITYIKGQAFLRMLEAYLGEDAFRKGMRDYMARHQYSNTTSADLWAALEKASGKPVARLATDWTTQPGLPVLSVSQACEDGKRKVTLAQEQFRLDEPASEKRQWHIPVQLGSVGGKTSYALLTSRSATLTLPGCEGALVVDPASVGYFRVQYDEAGFAALAKQAPRLPDTARLRLLTDSWAMVQSGRMQLDGYLKLVDTYRDEARVAVWEIILANLATLDGLASNEPERALIQRFVIALAAPRMQQLGWEEKQGDAPQDRELRAMLAEALANAGDKNAIDEAGRRFARYLADPASVPPSMIDFVIGTAGRYADQATFEALLQRVMSTQSLEQRDRYGRALASARDPVLAERALKLALAPGLPAQFTSRVVPGVAQAGHVDLAWAFAQANRAALLKDQESIGQNRFFPSLVQWSAQTRHADMMETWIAREFGPDAQAAAQQVSNAIRTKSMQKQRLLPQVRAALN